MTSRSTRRQPTPSQSLPGACQAGADASDHATTADIAGFGRAHAPASPPATSRARALGAVRRRYGWRAYALPILTIITVATLTHPDGSTSRRRIAAHQVVVQQPASALQKASANAVQVEGADQHDAGFEAAATPAPIVIDLGSDAVTSCATSTYPQLILVSLSKQHMWACEGAKQVDEAPVTTGNTVHHDQTPTGSWRVQAKQRDRYLVGPGYRDYVHYWVPFDGDFGLHDAPWQTMPFGSKNWSTGGSHGCVHTPTATMAWLYKWAQVGRTVVTVEA